MRRIYRIAFLSLALLIVVGNKGYCADGVIRIGFNVAQTGMFDLVGKHAINAGELVRKELEKEGGLKVGGKTYNVEFLYGDHTSDPSVAGALAVKQISQEKVIAIIGPLISRQAIPVAQMAQAYSTPMITPWSTSPLTTKDRPFVFRTCFVFTIQGPVLTKFAASQFNATKAAVLYDIISDYPRGMANSFKEAFEAANGAGSVVAFEEFRTGDTDFSKQFRRIKDSGAQFIFTPQHYNEVPLIVRQAKTLGVTIPIVGSNSWAGGDLIGQCGSDCNGLFFTGNYAPGNAQGINKGFVVSKPEVDTRKLKISHRRGSKGKRVALIREVVREIAGFAPYEKRMQVLLRTGDSVKEKKALKLAKSRLGTIRRAKSKKAEMEAIIQA